MVRKPNIVVHMALLRYINHCEARKLKSGILRYIIEVY